MAGAIGKFMCRIHWAETLYGFLFPAIYRMDGEAIAVGSSLSDTKVFADTQTMVPGDYYI